MAKENMINPENFGYNLLHDLTNGILAPEQLIRAMGSTDTFRFVQNKKTNLDMVKVRLDNKVIREYPVEDIVDYMENAFCSSLIERFDKFRLAYISEFNPDFKIPDSAPLAEIKKLRRELNKNTEDYVVEQKIKETFLAEHDVKPEDLDNNIEWLKTKNDAKKTLYETNVIHLFIEVFTILNVFEKAFRINTTYAPSIFSYKQSRQDSCMRWMEKCNSISPDMQLVTLSTLLRKKSAIIRVLDKNWGIKPLSDFDVIMCLEKYLKDEDYEEFITKYGDCIIDREEVIKYLTTQDKDGEKGKSGRMTYEEFQQKVNRSDLENYYLTTHDRELLQYMSKEQITKLYADGNIEDRDLRKYIKPDEILDLPIDKEIKLVALMCSGNGKVFSSKHSEKIWKMVETGEFTIDNLRKLDDAGYFSIDTIVKQYIENSKRQIASELGELPKVSDDNLFKYFTPEILMKEISKHDDDTLIFYKDMLKNIYEKNGANLEDVIKGELLKDSDKKLASEKACSMFVDGIVSPDTLKEIGISEDDAVKLALDNRDNEKRLIDLFNSGLVSELRMFEEVLDMDFDLACELIGKGMSARVIGGLESTANLIDMTRAKYDKDGNEIPPVLTYENLAEIKDDIVTGIDEKGMTKSDNGTSTLLELYLSDNLSFAELYGLMEAGVITIDEANEIDEKYGYIKDWEELKEQGVKGHPLERLLLPNPESDSRPGISKGTVGIDEDCIIDLYISLGAEEYLEIDSNECPVFKDYIVIPIMDKKVAYLEESGGRTYIVPLKIVLEQINNPKGELDLIGNAPSRTIFNSQKQHIRSVNHTRNWGRKLLQKTADLPSVPISKEDADMFIIDNLTTIQAIEKSYDNRKYSMDKSQNE